MTTPKFAAGPYKVEHATTTPISYIVAIAPTGLAFPVGRVLKIADGCPGTRKDYAALFAAAPALYAAAIDMLATFDADADTAPIRALRDAVAMATTV